MNVGAFGSASTSAASFSPLRYRGCHWHFHVFMLLRNSNQKIVLRQQNVHRQRDVLDLLTSDWRQRDGLLAFEPDVLIAEAICITGSDSHHKVELCAGDHNNRRTRKMCRQTAPGCDCECFAYPG
jgi:hypothetical protein